MRDIDTGEIINKPKRHQRVIGAYAALSSTCLLVQIGSYIGNGELYNTRVYIVDVPGYSHVKELPLWRSAGSRFDGVPAWACNNAK